MYELLPGVAWSLEAFNIIYTKIKKATIRSSGTHTVFILGLLNPFWLALSQPLWKETPCPFLISILKLHSYRVEGTSAWQNKSYLVVTYLFIKEIFPIQLTPRKMPWKCCEFSTIVWHKILDSKTILNIPSAFFSLPVDLRFPQVSLLFVLENLL